jgi:DNA-binding response OmpR family regulator
MSAIHQPEYAPDLLRKHEMMHAFIDVPLVLIVETDASLVSSMTAYLQTNGFRVISSPSCADAIARTRLDPPDVIVINHRLPAIDGVELCAALRNESEVPILMSSALTEDLDLVIGLDSGADDYMSTPLSMRELVARLRALVRRSSWRRTSVTHARVVIGDLELDERGRIVWRAGQEIALKPKEFDLLKYLARNLGRVVTRDQILELVWGYDFVGGTRTVDVHVRWLREKLEEDPSRPRYLLTVRGVGYMLVG